MNAAFFKPLPSGPASGIAPGGRGRSRRVHHWVAIVFTVAVAANFAVMPWGQLATGLIMLVSPWIAAARLRASARRGAIR